MTPYEKLNKDIMGGIEKAKRGERHPKVRGD
jgi:hypothetical protein